MSTFGQWAVILILLAFAPFCYWRAAQGKHVPIWATVLSYIGVFFLGGGIGALLLVGGIIGIGWVGFIIICSFLVHYYVLRTFKQHGSKKPE